MTARELVKQHSKALVSALALAFVLPWLLSSLVVSIIHQEALHQLESIDLFLKATNAQVGLDYQSLEPHQQQISLSSYSELLNQQSKILLFEEVQAALERGQASSMRELGDLNLLTSFASYDQASGRLFFARSQLFQAASARYGAIATGLILALILPLAISIYMARRKAKQLRELGYVMDNASALLTDNKLLSTSQLNPDIKLLVEQFQSAVANMWPERLSLIKRKTELELILQTTDEGMVVLNSACRIKSINQQARELLDLQEEDLRGQALVHLVRVPLVMELLERCLKGEDHLEGEVTLYRKKPLHLRLTVHRIVANKENSGGILLIVADVSSLKHLEEVRRDFVANVSHELRTPITAIRGFAETLADGAKNDPVQNSRFIDIILRQSQRLESIIDDLLSLSQIEQTGASIAREQGSLAELASDALEIVRAKALEKNTSLLVEGKDCKVQANRALLEQVMVNLMDNAIKYCPQGSSIKLSWHMKDQKLWISVQDNGPGIPVKDQEHIFERFYRIDKARSRNMGGTGLGLSIVKHIVLAHGGTIELKSIPGEGSTFLICLPQEAS